MNKAPAQLAVDEQLFLQATKTLADLEGGEEKYEISSALHAFLHEPYIAARCRTDIGREIDAEEKRAVENYVAGVYLPNHHHLYFERIQEHAEWFVGPVADFVRSVAWAYLTAWTQRYGGMHERLRIGGILIDPAIDDVKK